MTIGSVTEAITREMSTLGDVVVDALVAEIAAREKARVTPMMVTVYEKILVAQKIVDKMKPDAVTLNDKGEVVSANWTRKGLDDKAKAAKNLAILIAAFEKGMAGDFSEVTKHANSPKGDTNVRNGDET